MLCHCSALPRRSFSRRRKGKWMSLYAVFAIASCDRDAPLPRDILIIIITIIISSSSSYIILNNTVPQYITIPHHTTADHHQTLPSYTLLSYPSTPFQQRTKHFSRTHSHVPIVSPSIARHTRQTKIRDPASRWENPRKSVPEINLSQTCRATRAYQRKRPYQRQYCMVGTKLSCWI